MLTMASVALLSGGVIYLLFRPDSLYMFKWFTALKSLKHVFVQLPHVDLPDIMVYSLPDGLWLLSYILIIGIIWDFQTKKCIAFLALMPFFSLFHELLQWLNLFGTFDIYDLFSYFCATIIGLFIINICNIIITNNYNYEKSI